MDSMYPPRWNREYGWYGLAFGLALALRLLRLGAFPLTDLEAVPALQALDVSLGLRTGIGPHSAYVLFTSIFFYAFESSNFFARLAPALTGSLLVFAPLLFRARLKPRAALFLAFFLALDPGLLAISRQAGSAIFAITFLLFAWGFWERGAMRRAGVFAALALLSGPALWPGLLGLGLTWAILRLIYRQAPAASEPADKPDLRAFWPTFLAVLLLFGTLFFLAPAGLGGLFNGLADYLQRWVTPSEVPSSRMYLSLAFYQPLALLFALIAIVRGWWVGSRRVTRLSVWMLAALLLAVFQPGRQVQDLAWMLLPLSALAALELSRHIDLHRAERTEVLGVSALTVLILTFSWLNLSGLLWTPPGAEQSTVRILLFVGAIFLLAVSLLLVAVGWSLRTARLGAVWGLTVSLGLLTLGAGMGAGHIRPAYTSEMWDAGNYPVHAGLVAATVDDLSEWQTGSRTDLPVTISGLNAPALEWALHRHEVTVVDTLDASSAPPLLITPLRNEPALASPYRGQDFTWDQRPTWEGGFNEWLRWLVLREMPQNFDTIMLWARDDLFIDTNSPFAP